MKQAHMMKVMMAMGAMALSAQAQDSNPFAPAASTPVATTTSAPKAASSDVNFDVIRGNAYLQGAFGNMASAFTVNDYLAWPHLMGGSKFLYIEPTNKDATAAVPIGGNTVFMNLQDGVGGNLGVTTIGLASTDKFGASLSVGKNKAYNTEKDVGGATTNQTFTGQGDVVGANFSMPMSGNAIGASLTWTTFKDQASFTNDDKSYSDYLAVVNYSNFPTATALVWSAVSVRRTHVTHLAHT